MFQNRPTAVLTMAILSIIFGGVGLLSRTCGGSTLCGTVQAGEILGPGSVRTDPFGDPLPEGAISRLGTIRLRHGGFTTTVQFAPDSKSLLTMGADGLRIWDATTGKPLHRLINQKDRNLSPGVLSPDGKQVVTVELNRQNQLLRLWDVASGQLVREFGDHPCVSASFSPDGQTLATLGTSQPGDARFRAFRNVISLWDLTTGQRKQSWTGDSDGVYCGLFTADGQTLITGGADKAIRFWETATGREIRRLPEGTTPMGHLALSPDGKHLAAIGLRDSQPAGTLFPSCLAWHADNLILVWDLTTGKEVQRLTLPRSEQQGVSGFTAAGFAPDGRTLITAGVDRFARRWDLAKGKETRRYDLGHPAVWALALSSDGRTMAGLPGGNTVRLIDIESGKEPLISVGHRNELRWAVLTPDKRMAVTAASADPAILLWDVATGRERHRLVGHEKFVSGMVAAGDGRTLYSVGSGDDALIVWDLLTGKLLRRMPAPPALKARPGSIALSPDEKTLALAESVGEMVVLIDTATAKEVRQLRGPTKKPGEGIYLIAFTPDGRTLVAFCHDRSIQFWDIAKGVAVREFLPSGTMRLRGGLRPVGLDATALSPDGKLLAYVTHNGNPVLCDLTTEKPLHLDTEYARGVSTVAFSADSRNFAWTGWHDSTIHLMEVATGKERHRFFGHEGRGQVHCLTFSADGQVLMSGSADTTALVWDLTGGEAARGATAQALPPQALEACWADLASDDAVRAFRAIRKLTAAPVQALPYLWRRVSPAPVADDKLLARLLADLDSDQFPVRQRAAEELGRLGEAAVAACQKAMERGPSPEVRRRLEALLDKQLQERRHPSSDRLRQLRALEALELAGTPDARRLLEALAKGAPEARLTQDANASARRLSRRPNDQ